MEIKNNLTEEKIQKVKNLRWIIWGILCMVYVIVFFHRLAVGVVKVDLMQTFSITASTFANLGSVYFYAYMIMQIPTGMLVDTLGVRITVTAGTVLAGIGSIIFGFAPTVYIAFLGRIMVGVGVSVVFISILKIQTQWFFEKDFATMSGLTTFFGNLGGALAQTPLVILISIITWRYSFVMIGLITCIIAALCFKIIRNTPSEIGLPSVSEMEGKKAQEEKVNLFEGLLKVCRNPYTWPPFLMFAGFYGAFHALTGVWGHSYLTTVYGMNDVKAANYMAIAVLGFSVAGVLIGKLSDKILKRKAPIIVFGTVYLISWMVLAFFGDGKPPESILGILFFILGFSVASFVLGWACGKEVNDPKYAGISISVINTGGFMGAAIVPVILGRIIDKYQHILSPQQLFSKAFLLCALSVGLGYLFVFFIRETNCRNVYPIANRR